MTPNCSQLTSTLRPETTMRMLVERFGTTDVIIILLDPREDAELLNFTVCKHLTDVSVHPKETGRGFKLSLLRISKSCCCFLMLHCEYSFSSIQS